jgi:hypothetical protein
VLKEVTIKELKRLARKFAGDIDRIYLHWSASYYNADFYGYDHYHVIVDGDGKIFITTNDLTELKAHTWRRNSRAVGIAMACCVDATSVDLGDYPPTEIQIENFCMAIAALCIGLELPVNVEHVVTHAEIADEDGYGIDSRESDMRWDLLFLKNGDEYFSGGKILRGKANFYIDTRQV